MNTVDPIQKIWSDIAELRKKTKGRGVKVAILDGSIDTKHPCFSGSKLSFTDNKPAADMATAHGTHVASILLSTATEQLQGICPGIECLSIPIFRARKDGQIIPSSQLELARSIEMALSAGANIINISAGEKVLTADPQQRLQKVIERCVKEQVLLVSAVGNDGCPCIHVPAIHPNVLAVGALDIKGHPTSFSNWGTAYKFNGIMAPGEDIMGANPQGGYSKKSGTSFATPIVSGVVALIYSYFKNHLSLAVSPLSIKTAILNSSLGCPIDLPQDTEACDRFLKGVLNISGAIQLLKEKPQLEIVLQPNSLKKVKLQEGNFIYKKALLPQQLPQTKATNWVFSSEYDLVKDSELPLVFAVGTLDVDYQTDAVLDSFRFYMRNLFQRERLAIEHPDPYNPQHLTTYLRGGEGENNYYDAARVTWIIKINGTPIYAISPSGAFSKLAYKQLIEFFKTTSDFKEEFLDKSIKYRMELCSIAGHITGETRLKSGQKLPVICPNIRVMYNWARKDLVEDITQYMDQYQQKIRGGVLFDLIDRLAARLTFKLEHLGLSAEERALNYVATNLYNLGNTFSAKLSDGYELSDIHVEASAICRPDSNCQDVIVTFFKPAEQFKIAKHIFRLTVDVSKVVPVTVGAINEWFDY